MNSATGAAEVKVLSKEQEADTTHFRDKDSNAELEVQEKMSLLEWLANSYKKFGCALEFVTNKSQEVCAYIALIFTRLEIKRGCPNRSQEV